MQKANRATKAPFNYGDVSYIYVCVELCLLKLGCLVPSGKLEL